MMIKLKAIFYEIKYEVRFLWFIRASVTLADLWETVVNEVKICREILRNPKLADELLGVYKTAGMMFKGL